jgi:uncharacterized membrane protein YphA (DoxX/SURF4 family)
VEGEFPPPIWLFPRRARVRDLVLRGLGVVYLIAFLSLLPQISLLIGPRGLLPAMEHLAFLDSVGASFADAPIVLPVASERGLEAVLVVGALASVALALGWAPRIALIVVWATYSSIAGLTQDFLGFQWDNLLLESAFFAWFAADWRLRPRAPREPHPVAAALLVWLVFRLHFESGIAKILGGDPTWRDFTAMASYYETAPIPTALGWWVHQLPPWFHRTTTMAVLVIEVGVPLLLFAGHRARGVAVAVLVATQAGIFLTANYGFFNPLTIVLCLFALDDDHLAWVATRLGRTLAPARGAPAPERQDLLALRIFGGGVLAAVSVLPFAPFIPVAPPRAALRLLHSTRTINAYHLFVHMTLVRKEVVIEGSEDGERWESYELRWKPGDVDRAPPFVAPHQPRVDFLFWFLTLGRGSDPWFQRLARAVQDDPDAVAPLFSRNPFPRGPRFVRVSVWRYVFTDLATRRATGAWWTRTFEGASNAIEKRGG